MGTIRTAIALYDGVTSPLKSMHKAMGIVLNSFESIRQASGRAVDTASIREAREEWARAGTAFDAIEQNIREADDKQKQFNQSIRGGGSATNGLISKFKGVAAAVGGLLGAKKVIEISDQLTSNKARLNLLVEDGGSVEELERKIMASAQRSRAYYMDTTAAVAKLGMNAKDAFSGMDEVIAFSELINKQFVIGGASAQEQAASMLQLTQAMASGVLRGEELNSIFENAPGIIQNISDYLDVPIGEIRTMASEGQITAEIVKNAMFAASDGINTKFESMPKTWGQILTGMQNKALTVFSPILNKINQIANSSRFETVTNGIINGLAAVAAVATMVLDLLIGGASFVVDNWSIIAPIIGAVAAALLLYNGYLVAHNVIETISNGLKTLGAIKAVAHGAAITAEMTATTGMTAAQLTLNAALYACPLVWIIILIIALIAIVYAAVAAVNHFAGTSISATGVICGAFALLGANLYNTFIVPVWNGIAAFVNFFANVFNDPIASIQILFLDLASNIIGYVTSMAEAIEAVINKIPGVEIDITSGLHDFQKKIQDTSATIKSESEWKEVAQTLEYMDPKKAMESGYAFGEGIDEKVSGLFSFDNSGFEDYMDNIYSNTNDISKNTAASADALEYTEEDLRYLKDLAEREAINRFTTAEIKVDMTNNNTVNNNGDLDGIVTYLSDTLRTELSILADGVHA